MYTIHGKLNIVMPEIKAQFPEIAKMVDYNYYNSPISNDTFEKAMQGDINARNLIIMKNIPYIVYWAYTICKYFKKLNMFEDEVNNTIVWICEYFQNVYKTSGYAVFKVKLYQRIIPKITHDLLYKDLEYAIATVNKPIHAAITQLFALYGYDDNLTYSDILEIVNSNTDLSVCQIYNILYPYEYLDGSYDELYTEDNYIEHNCLIQEVSNALSKLTIRESVVLILRAGLSNECYQPFISEYCKQCKIEPFKVMRPHTLVEVANILGYHQSESIRQIEAKALRKLRHPSRGEILEEFYWNE